VILERALKRLEWERVQEKEAKAKAAREDAEREAMMSVDWHEFAVVETIEFYDDEVDDLPAPMTLKDVSGVGGGGGGRGLRVECWLAGAEAGDFSSASQASCLHTVAVLLLGQPLGVDCPAPCTRPFLLLQLLRAAKAGQKYEEPEPEAAAATAAAAAQQGMGMDAEERALVQQGVAAGAGGAPAGGAAEVDADMDMDVSDDEAAGQQQQRQAAAAAEASAAAAKQAAAAAAAAEEEEQDGPMRVVKNYQRPAARQQQQYDPTK
jgi:hypothetical protein